MKYIIVRSLAPDEIFIDVRCYEAETTKEALHEWFYDNNVYDPEDRKDIITFYEDRLNQKFDIDNTEQLVEALENYYAICNIQVHSLEGYNIKKELEITTY